MLVTGYDILFFWVARMMMFGLYAMRTAGRPRPSRSTPSRCTAWCATSTARRCPSRPATPSTRWSGWTAYGTDALRFALARAANPGTDAPIGEDNVAAARNFGTKLWNATRFALANGASPGAAAARGSERAEPTDADAWILGRLREVREQIDALLEDFQFAKAAEGLYHFTWDEFCDWYLELAKPQLADEATADGTRAVLGHVLDALLRLLHPVIPFLTEALWQALTGGESVVIAPWPRRRSGAPVDARPRPGGRRLQKLVTEIRRFRTEQRVPDSRRVAARLVGLDEAGLGAAPGGDRRRWSGWTSPARRVHADGHARGRAAPAARCVVELDTSGAIDVAAERARLGRDLAAAQKELDQADKKLGNPKFVDKAPADVVDGIRGAAGRGGRRTSSGSRRGWRRCRT